MYDYSISVHMVEDHDTPVPSEYAILLLCNGQTDAIVSAVNSVLLSLEVLTAQSAAAITGAASSIQRMFPGVVVPFVLDLRPRPSLVDGA